MAQRAARELGKLPLKIRFWLTVSGLVLLLLYVLYLLASHGWDVEKAFGPQTEPGITVGTGFAGSGMEEYSTAAIVLDTLEVRRASDFVGYNRSNFGEPWSDIDGNGCDQRNDILARDLMQTERNRHCAVLSGSFIDPYTGQELAFTRGAHSSQDVPIDHVVALAHAWVSGAMSLTEEERTHLANDPLNLQATGQTPNTNKSSKDASRWLPQAGYRCEYVARQVSVKAAYDLWVTPQEKEAMGQVLKTCPEQPAYRSTYQIR